MGLSGVIRDGVRRVIRGGPRGPIPDPVRGGVREGSGRGPETPECDQTGGTVRGMGIPRKPRKPSKTIKNGSGTPFTLEQTCL